MADDMARLAGSTIHLVSPIHFTILGTPEYVVAEAGLYRNPFDDVPFTFFRRS
jgi:hypothetical protein